MRMKNKIFSSCAQVFILTLLACSCSVYAWEFWDRGDGPLFCANSSPSPSAPVSVHSLRPADVSMVSALVLSDRQRSDEIGALNRLSEILYTFNPDLSTVLPGLRNSAEEILQSLNPHQWNLLLLIVPADELCVCPGQDLRHVVDKTVSKLEKELDVLHRKLKKTLVHVVVWNGLPSTEAHKQYYTCQCEEAFNENKHRLDRIVLMGALQESVDALLKRKHWFSNREDFSVMLQSSPVNTDLSEYKAKESSHDISKLALQLWANLLQPMRTEKETGVIPCPTEEKPYLCTQRNSYSQPKPRTSEPLLHPVMGSELTCEDRAPSDGIPMSVHQLRPADIKVVAAMGDSITAANGVGAAPDNLLDVLREYRGLSWSIGGDQDLSNVTTLPNILKEFNPDVVGFSIGSGGETFNRSFLNQAVPGAKADDMVKQAQAIIKIMKEDPRVDFENDWKIITMFIGGNDICDHCSDTLYYSPENIVKRIREGLDVFHAEVPRAIVNLVEMLDIIPLRAFHGEIDLGCPTWLVNILCRCVLQPKDGSQEYQLLVDFNRAYQTGMQDLVESARYDTRDDFTVVLQPFFRHLSIPTLEDGTPDRSYFTPDCFHLSQKSHTLMARALWNNMLEPVGDKTDNHDFSSGVPLMCPDESVPFFRTAKNSDYTYQPAPTKPPPPDNFGSDFLCEDTTPSDTVPTSVHRLRPGDIKVVASLGDSITAGFGAQAENVFQLPQEARGVSWSIGGDETLETVTTLPNILKKFNPNVIGFSNGKDKPPNNFNMAIGGAKAMNIKKQTENLIENLKNNASVDFENDWKLVTLFIGGNDLCQYCHDRAGLSPQNFIGHIRESLDLLYKEVPRVLVNFVEVLEIRDLRMVKKDSLGCELLQENLCPCFVQPGENSPELSEMKKINRDLQTETERLVYGGRYDEREDFAVVLQPFFKNSVLPRTLDGAPDGSYFAPDCFHFAERGHAEMAIALWNNMLEPVGIKQTYNNFTHDRTKLHCPTKEQPFIFTRVNSGSGDPIPTIQPPGTPIPEDCPNNTIPAWGAALLGVGGLLVGLIITSAFFYFKERRNRKKNRNSSETQLH